MRSWVRSEGMTAPDTRSKEGLTVAVTGAAGYIGSRLLGVLCSDDRVDRVLAFDVREPQNLPGKIVFDTVDVRNPHMEARLRGVDAVVHLAFVMNPIKDETSMRDVNVNGTRNLLRSAARAGVGKVIYTSSATVYGAHPDNDLPLTERSPLRANLDFSYPAHKLEAEYVVSEVAEEFPETALTVFRPAIVFGPHADNAWSHVLEQPVLILVTDCRPPMQFVHEEDVVRALAWAVGEDHPGTFNLAAPGWLDHEEVLEIVGRRTCELSEPLAYTTLQRLWNLGLAEAPAGLLHYLMYPWVVATDKLQAEGFVAQHSNWEALRATVARPSRYIRIGRSRLDRRAVRWGGVAGAGLAGAALATRVLTRDRTSA